MIVIGFLLILVAAGAVTFVLMAPAATSPVIEMTALGVKVSASPLAVFLAGAISLALLVLGFAMINRGTRRRASSRKELHQLRKEQAAAGASTSTAEKQSSRPDRPEHTSSTASGNTDSTNKDSESPTSR